MTKPLSVIKLIPFLGCLGLFLPILSIVYIAISVSSHSFNHLANTVLIDYIKNSIILVVGVCFFSLVWGVPCAWLISQYQFLGRRIFSWALMLPMAMPSYLVAFIYTDLFDYSGSIQVTIREVFGFTHPSDYWFFDLRTMGGTIFVLSLVLSPYVYWICRINFANQCQSHIQSAKLLGCSDFKAFMQVALPLSRPAIAISCTLVGMETLADYGAVSLFSTHHLTTAIYDIWLNHFDLSGAAKLASLLLFFIVCLVMIEKSSRSKASYSSFKPHPIPLKKLSPKISFVAGLWCFTILFLGFLLPFYYVVSNALLYFDQTHWEVFLITLKNTLVLATIVASTAVIFALFIQTINRHKPSRLNRLYIGISSLGYAVPGAVLAIGIIVITAGIDKNINNTLEYLGFNRIGLIFSGTLIAMAYGFLVRFSAISIGTVGAGLNQIPQSLDNSATIHGYNYWFILKKIFTPLLKKSLFIAFLLVFIESLKELSAAILLRPFNVETLSTYIYQYAVTEDFERASLPALILVLIGLPAIYFIIKMMDNKQII